MKGSGDAWSSRRPSGPLIAYHTTLTSISPDFGFDTSSAGKRSRDSTVAWNFRVPESPNPRQTAWTNGIASVPLTCTDMIPLQTSEEVGRYRKQFFFRVVKSSKGELGISLGTF